jgi:hypothetical protein
LNTRVIVLENKESGDDKLENVTVRQWSEETQQAVDKLCLFDDDFMSLIFDGNIEATEFLLNTIFGRTDLKVIEVKGQYEYKNVLPYRCMIIDIRAVDETGKLYDVEVQKADSGAIPQRARFHSSLIDSKLLKQGQEFKDIKDSYVIFITQNDVIGAGLPLYHIERVIKETKEEFGDGSHIIYVNGAYKDDDSAIGRLIHDFGCVKSSDMYCEVLKNCVKYYKETEGGRNIMCQIIEEFADKRAETKRIDTSFYLVKNLMDSMNLTVEQAMEALKIAEDDKAEILKRM